MGITHFDEAPSASRRRRPSREPLDVPGRGGRVGHDVGLQPDPGRRRAAGRRPAHEHGREEEIFYVLAGRGLSWQRRRTTAEIGAGDCIVYLPGEGAHTLHGARRPRRARVRPPASTRRERPLPPPGLSLVGGRAVETMPGAHRRRTRSSSSARPSSARPSSRHEPGPRPSTIVNLADVEPVRLERPGSCARAGTSVSGRRIGQRPASSTSRSPRARSPRRSTATRSRRSSSSSSTATACSLLGDEEIAGAAGQRRRAAGRRPGSRTCSGPATTA